MSVSPACSAPVLSRRDRAPVSSVIMVLTACLLRRERPPVQRHPPAPAPRRDRRSDRRREIPIMPGARDLRRRDRRQRAVQRHCVTVARPQHRPDEVPPVERREHGLCRVVVHVGAVLVRVDGHEPAGVDPKRREKRDPAPRARRTARSRVERARARPRAAHRSAAPAGPTYRRRSRRRPRRIRPSRPGRCDQT